MPTIKDTTPIARKTYKCDRCSKLIKKGERYRRWVGVSDLWTGLATEKQCLSCRTRYSGKP